MSEREGAEPVDKPDALLALHDVTAELFATLRRWFDVPPLVAIDLAEVDSAVLELGDPVMIAAMAMRKLQALHLLATPGVRTSTDVVVAIVSDLDRALVQAPNMALKRRAETTDWDAALSDLVDHPETKSETETETETEGGDSDGDDGPDDGDAEVVRFRLLHAALHEAMFAVVEASEGEIRYFV